MALEPNVNNGIYDLNPAAPAETDLIREGDNHIRLIKTALKTTFPGLNAPITFTSTKLNQMDATLATDASGIGIVAGKSLSINGTLIAAPTATIDFSGAVVKNVGTPVVPTDGTNAQYVATYFVQRDGGTSMTGALNMTGNKVVNLGEPAIGTDAATANYVQSVAHDVTLSSVQKSGDTMTGLLTARSGIELSGSKITGVGDPAIPSDVANAKYALSVATDVKSLSVQKSGDTMTGNLTTPSVHATSFITVDGGATVKGGMVVDTGLSVNSGGFVSKGSDVPITAGPGLPGSGNSVTLHSTQSNPNPNNTTCYTQYNWFSDAIITGPIRGGAANLISYNIYYNDGFHNGAQPRTWKFNVDGSFENPGKITCYGLEVDNAPVTFNSAAVLYAAGGINVESGKGLSILGKVQAGNTGNPATSGNSDTYYVAGDGNTGNTGVVGGWQHNWYRDAYVVGAARDAGFGLSAYNIYYNGGSTGTAKLWTFNVNGDANSQGNWNGGSDKRVKTEINKITNAVETIKKVNGYTYNKFGKPDVGLIAQEVESVCPSAISKNKGTLLDGTEVDDFHYINLSGFWAAYGLEAMKELIERLEKAEAKIAELEAAK